MHTLIRLSLIEAIDWKKANLDESLMLAAKNAAIFAQSVDDLELSGRASYYLYLEDIIYIGDLVQLSEAELLRMPGFGRRFLTETRANLARAGLHLGTEIPEWSNHRMILQSNRKPTFERAQKYGCMLLRRKREAATKKSPPLVKD